MNMAAAASDEDIARGVEVLLRLSDPKSVTSLNDVVQKLEANLGFDLSHKAAFIRDHITLLLRSHPCPQPPADHFTLHHYPPYPNYHHPNNTHFSLHPHHRRPEELNFRTHLQLPPPPLSNAEAFVQNAAAIIPKSPKESAPAVSKRKGGSGGLSKVCGVSRELEAVLGESALPRTQIVKQLWIYIKKNNLQDPSNKRNILCDDALRSVFETDCTDMFKMNKLLAKHIIPLDPSKESAQAKRLKVDVESASESTEPSSSVAVISEMLSNFLGTQEREMLHSEALRRVWEYIKVNSLEDPLNSMVIICDAKLQELLGCESISALGVSEMLARNHLFHSS